MNKKDTRIILEEHQNDFLYERNKLRLNISFNRISFIFLFFF